MATIVEVGIRNIVACVVLPTPSSAPQLLVTCETHDADGNTVREYRTDDWWPTTEPADQASTANLLQTLAGRLHTVLAIP